MVKVYTIMKLSFSHFLYLLGFCFFIVGVTHAQQYINSQVNLGHSTDFGKRTINSTSVLANTFSFETSERLTNNPQRFIQGWLNEEELRSETVLPQGLSDAEIGIESRVDLSAEIRSISSRLFADNEFDYYIIVTNKSNEDAYSVTVINDLPDEIPYKIKHVEWSQDNEGINSTIFNGKIIWSIPVLLSNSSLEIKVTAELGTFDLDYPKKITHRVEVFSDGFEYNSEDNLFVETKELSPIFIPNVIEFSGDAEKGMFEIQGLKFFNSNELFVFNTFSDLVFFAQDYDNDWDTSPIDAGMYFYILTGVDKIGEYHEINGWLKIVK